MAGYSGTPLVKKLGIKPPLALAAINAPADYDAWLGALPEGVVVIRAAVRARAKPLQAAHLFTVRRSELAAQLAILRKALVPAGFVWVSWPKKASKVATDVSEDTIREVALPLGFVDVKVCAVTEVWSGLKLVIRKSERT
jgi:hypothetical protein